MYARQVAMQLKPDSRIDFTQKLESEILPLPRKQKGFWAPLPYAVLFMVTLAGFALVVGLGTEGLQG